MNHRANPPQNSLLTDDVLYEIFTYLDSSDLKASAATIKQFYAIIKSGNLLEKLPKPRINYNSTEIIETPIQAPQGLFNSDSTSFRKYEQSFLLLLPNKDILICDRHGNMVTLNVQRNEIERIYLNPVAQAATSDKDKPYISAITQFKDKIYQSESVNEKMKINIFDIETLTLISSITFEGSNENFRHITSLIILNNGDIVCGHRDTTISILDSQNFVVKYQLPSETQGYCYDILYLKELNERELLFVSKKFAGIWHFTKQAIKKFELLNDKDIECALLLSSGDLMLSCAQGQANGLYVFDIKTQQIKLMLDSITTPYIHLVELPHHHLASINRNHELKIWNIAEEKQSFLHKEPWGKKYNKYCNFQLFKEDFEKLKTVSPVNTIKVEANVAIATFNGDCLSVCSDNNYGKFTLWKFPRIQKSEHEGQKQVQSVQPIL